MTHEAIPCIGPDHLAVWKVMVVDDDPAIHQVTKLALRNLIVQERPVQWIHAMSASEAREQLICHPDIALALVDVVMETEHAGLELVHHIRQELNYTLMRIVLRTGQAGQAPERSVMVEYDINDYKEKTELTSNKLFTTVSASLRTYHQLSGLFRSHLVLETLWDLPQTVASTGSWSNLLERLVEKFAALGLTTGLVLQQLAADNSVTEITPVRWGAVPEAIPPSPIGAEPSGQGWGRWRCVASDGHVLELLVHCQDADPRKHPEWSLLTERLQIALSHWQPRSVDPSPSLAR